jgi:hypothetical protein
MPPRKNAGRKPAAAPEPEVEETPASTSKLDRLEKYLEGNITPTLTDYAEWFGDNVADPDQLDTDRLIALAVTFYSEFQASDFNRERRAARKEQREQRASANGSDGDEEEAEPAQPRTRGRGARGAAKPAAGKPAAKAGSKPAQRGRSRAAVY